MEREEWRKATKSETRAYYRELLRKPQPTLTDEIGLWLWSFKSSDKPVYTNGVLTGKIDRFKTTRGDPMLSLTEVLDANGGSPTLNLAAAIKSYVPLLHKSDFTEEKKLYVDTSNVLKELPEVTHMSVGTNSTGFRISFHRGNEPDITFEAKETGNQQDIYTAQVTLHGQPYDIQEVQDNPDANETGWDQDGPTISLPKPIGGFDVPATMTQNPGQHPNPKFYIH